MRPCAGLTYDEIWKLFKDEVYPHVSDHEKLQIHNKWKRLGKSVMLPK